MRNLTHRLETPLLTNLLARLKRVLCCQSRQNALQLVVLTHGAHTLTTLMIAAFHENWNIRYAVSPCHAMTLLRKAPTVGLVYDWDSQKGDWRDLCRACFERGVPFHLLADMPPDDLFLAVVGAGGAGVLWKPFNAEQMISNIGFARSFAGTPPDGAHNTQGDAAVGSRGDPSSVLRCD